ncbi:MAG: ArsR family transcriptional regulator [Promethearchaeota archaeon]
MLFHGQRSAILKALLAGEKKIIDLKKELKMNPGTIKRHLVKLVEVGLVEKPREVTNEYGIREKYYRTTARRFEVRLEWP